MLYHGFAQVYDRLMDDVPYDAWGNFWLEAARRRGISPTVWLDAACGTGNLTQRLAAQIPRVIGADRSAQMLALAEAKSRGGRHNIRYIAQDLRSLSLHHPADVVSCGCDGVNYLTTLADVTAFLHAASGCLRPGGMLIFDVSTREKLQGLHEITIAEDRGDVAFIWQNHYQPDAYLLRMTLSLFIGQGPQVTRYTETHLQRGHSQLELTALLGEAGFTDIVCCASFAFDSPVAGGERLHLIATRS